MTSKPPKNPGRQPSDTITKEHLEEFIATQDDFALELFAYSTALDLGFSAKHAGSYTDPATGKARQFDVQATLQCGERLHVHLSIECKSLRPNHPVLVSQIPRSPSESFQDVILTSGVDPRHPRMPALFPSVRRIIGVQSFYPPNVYVGKAISQVGFNGEGQLTSKDSDVFEKWSQALASANQLMNTAAMLNQSLSGSLQRSVILPILVVQDGTLWIANYWENGSRQDGPRQTDYAEYFVGNKQTFKSNPTDNYTLSHLHIVTKTGLRSLLLDFTQGGRYATRLAESLN